MKSDWITGFLMLGLAAVAVMAVHRGTQLARELKECRENHLAYTEYIGRELCAISRQLGIRNPATCK